MEEIDALIARADACLTAHETHEAMQQYQQVLALQPQHAHALHRMGIACFRLEQNDRSRQYLDAALSAAPQRADIWEHRGILASATGDLVAAEAFYHRALSLAGSTVTLHRNLADSLRLSNRFAEARLHYSKALELDPGLHHAVLGLARVSSELGQLDEAADYWQRAWALDSTQISDALELITAMSQAGRDTQIDGLLAKLRTRFAGDAAALERLAFAMNSIHRFREAIGVAVQGLAVDPQNAWLHHNASYAFNTLGKFDPMRVHTIEAAELLPDNPRMQFNLAATQLRLGDFERGWKQYRWHEALPENHDLVRPGYPEWQGEPVAGCRFLLVGEQGLGDQLQFLRLADWLHRQGASVDVWVEAPLGELARNAAGVHAAWTTVPPGPYDYWCRMLRMPEHMKLEPSMLPLAMPYLTAAPDDARRWQKRLDAIDAIDAIDDADRSATRRKRIGLVWAGNPAYGLDRFRSIPLERFRIIIEQPGVKWFSVQMGRAGEEAAALPGEIGMHMLGPEIVNFTDTLAIFNALDLVITVDTAVAHLAGAAGRPVWILLPTCTDWRWMIERTDSPWYPSARLFRQRELGRWEPVLEEVRGALQDYLQDTRA
ncbi:Tfp pilus assembly protein PilF [Paraburkholderia phenazinium]|uniref:Tfp pilus assembly protein PilF n=1 Tax=Paraburkholderia phenazinium TaxID=60549 RepID=A0A1G8FGG6_9BURK|nr:tetratricopeptide repeat protein [Paraburkholderia phenazinium]SDH81228.1 Tfp pilus assembly protein PilF [Paraburkholderia phenazinium]